MTQNPTILIVDDDEEIRTLLAEFLGRHGYVTLGAADGVEMKQHLGARDDIDLVVLDLMMPGEDGLSLCRGLRMTSNVSVIMLSAMGEETDRIVGLEMGADDYLPKPFNPRELLARIKAVLRRRSDVIVTEQAPASSNAMTANVEKAFYFADWCLEPHSRRLVSPDGVETPLSAGEYDLLITFVEHPGRVLNRDQLLDFAKGRMAIPFDRSIDVQISRLRRKLGEDPKNPQMIKTVRGGGYLFAIAVEVRGRS